MPNILVVDDERPILDSVCAVLKDEGYETSTAESGLDGIKKAKEDSPDLILLDVWMPGIDGLETLTRLREQNPETPVIIMSGHASIDTAVKAVRLGAYDFLEKPLSIEKLELTIKNALDRKRLETENQALRARVEGKYTIIGDSPKMAALKDAINLAGPTNGRVLISGENGTGKELVARAIHRLSFRADGPFITVNCAAIPEELIESELFGHEKGAFTGAIATRKGKFELADKGTIFLDEIADMSLYTQAKVLRTLQEQELQRVGGSKTIHIDVRVIAASNKMLETEIKSGRFREDLYYRLNVIPLHVPPLRERREDIPALVDWFMREYAAEYGAKPKSLSPEALNLFTAYLWPGNIREMRNIIERLAIMSPGPVILEGNVPSPIRESAPDSPGGQMFDGIDSLREARAAFEKGFITRKLRENNWNISRTADVLKIERSNLHRKITALGIEVEE